MRRAFAGRLCTGKLWRRTLSPLVYTASAPPPPGRFSIPSPSRETDLPAQRAPAEASARLPCADGDARRTRDPQAPPRERPQAPLRLSPPDARAPPPPPLACPRLR